MESRRDYRRVAGAVVAIYFSIVAIVAAVTHEMVALLTGTALASGLIPVLTFLFVEFAASSWREGPFSEDLLCELAECGSSPKDIDLLLVVCRWFGRGVGRVVG